MGTRRQQLGPDGLVYESFDPKSGKSRRGEKSLLRARDPQTGRFVASEQAQAVNKIKRKKPEITTRVREDGGVWRLWKKGDTRKRLQVAEFQGNKIKRVISHDFAKHTKKTLAHIDAGVEKAVTRKGDIISFSGRGESIADCLEPLDFGPIGYGGVYAWQLQCKVIDNGEEIELFADGAEDYRQHYSKEQLEYLFEKSIHINHGLPDGETYHSILKHNMAHQLRRAFSARQIRFSSLQVLERIKDPKRWNKYPGEIVADALYDIWREKEQVYDLRFFLTFRTIKKAKTTKIQNFSRKLRNKKQKED